MGDIVGSSQYPGAALEQNFRALVADCNKHLARGILSPYTITLGDEFQGVARSLCNALDCIYFLEETALRWQYQFNFRYVLNHGSIDSPLNPDIAHGMLGPGLTRTRELLTTKRKKEWQSLLPLDLRSQYLNRRRRRRPRFLFVLADRKLARRLNLLFSIVESVVEDWRPADHLLISAMLACDSDGKVADQHDKNRSQIWKRRKSLQIEDYRTLKALAYDLAKDEKKP